MEELYAVLHKVYKHTNVYVFYFDPPYSHESQNTMDSIDDIPCEEGT
jgi:site-specific DNA-adenine methylase